jgi:hypothetical protein
MTSKDMEDQLNSDIMRFLENIRNQTKNDQIKTLRQLFDKHIHLNKAEYIMDSYDLNRIIGSAKQKFANDNMKIFLGERKVKVSPGDLPNLCVIEATIGHLNKIGCLKRLPKFDKREDRLPED